MAGLQWQNSGDLKEELDHFVQATLHKEPYLVDTDNTIRAVAIVEAAMKSIETGETVKLSKLL